ncbi:MAG: GGDEF domain-containing protein [bacterium]|nr:GGDEF domain-containing protein [bacterium]
MSRDEKDLRRRERNHRILFFALTGLLIAFSVWCVVLLWRTHELRADLDDQLAWIDDVRRLRAELDRSSADRVPEIDALRRDAERLTQRQTPPDLQIDVRNLRGALDRLTLGLSEEGSADAVWEASVAARSALAALEGRIQSQVTDLHGRLGNHWRGLNLLIVASLLLAASNLGLLRLAHLRRQSLEKAHLEVLRLSTQDPLTQIWNRDAILGLLRRELVRAERLDSLLGVILVDIDGFQQVNVLLGQDQGDFILEQLAGRLGSFVRPYDTMGRFGGDSFLIVLPMCDETATGNVADRLREAINDRDMEHALGRIRVTVSLAWGTVIAPEDADADLLIHRLQERIGELQYEGPGRIAQLT